MNSNSNSNSNRTSIDDIYTSDSKFLRAADLKGSRVVVEIARFEIAEVGDEKKSQIVLHFVGKEKVLGLNITNSKRIVALSGSKYPDDWIGGKIKIFPTKTEFGGREVDCIRVSEEFFEAPPNKQAGGSPENIDEIPF